METIQNQLNQAWIALKFALPIILWWLLATCLVNLVARRSQVDAWCEKRPRIAAVLKICRAFGFDPWLLIQGLSLIVIGKLPAKLRETIPVLIVAALAALLSGCAGTLDNARGQIKPALGAPKAAASARRCEQLSDRETLWGAIAEAGAIATGSGGLATLPIDNESIRRVIIGSTVVVAIGTGAAIYVTRKAAQQYIVERCATEAGTQ